MLGNFVEVILLQMNWTYSYEWSVCMALHAVQVSEVNGNAKKKMFMISWDKSLHIHWLYKQHCAQIVSVFIMNVQCACSLWLSVVIVHLKFRVLVKIAYNVPLRFAHQVFNKADGKIFLHFWCFPHRIRLKVFAFALKQTDVQSSGNKSK